MITSRRHSPSRRKGEPRRGRLARWYLVGIALCLGTCSGLERAESAEPSIWNLKLYAMNQFKSFDQFECYNWLVYKESRWNYKAVNGSHYGLGQIRNKAVLKQSPTYQIIFHMRYIGNRYGYVNNEPNACAALEHLELKGYS
jgi:hypothetical protein